jgi:hypothetical protein
MVSARCCPRNNENNEAGILDGFLKRGRHKKAVKNGDGTQPLNPKENSIRISLLSNDIGKSDGTRVTDEFCVTCKFCFKSIDAECF